MDYALIGIAAVVIAALLAGILAYIRSQKNAGKKERVLIGIKCPVCGTELFKGENIVSKVYRPRNVPDQLCSISGCPHCFPVAEPGKVRSCPVCHKTLSTDEYLTARLFNKTTGKNHIHILGCGHCRNGRSNELSE